MNKMEWTKEQKQAIETKNGKLLVAAGAGSGKTAVLVQRIIDKVIKDKVDIDRLLVVTFTNAAASEMRERIADALYQNAEEHPELNQQILLLNRASIMTIDAFCSKMIRDNFFLLDLDPNFKVADTTELELLKIEALDDVMESLYEEDSELIELYSTNKSDESFRNIILQIHQFIQSSPFPKQWLKEKCDMYDVPDGTDFGKTVWGKELLHFAREEIAGCIEELENAADSLMENSEGSNYLLTLQEDILQLKAIRLNNISWDDFYEDISKLKFISLKRAPKLDPEIAEDIKAIRNKVKDKLQVNLRDTIFIASSEEVIEDIHFLHMTLQKLANVVMQFHEAFQEKKREKNLIDFSDMEHLCLDLLTKNEDVRAMYQKQYEEILIDEYQDSNLIQETILNHISHGNVFMVGDVKQSIYKFRQAWPELFLEKYRTYADITGDIDVPIKEPSNGEPSEIVGRKICLFQNFRSNQNIIEECNEIFQHTMSKEVGDIDYVEKEYLKFGAEYYPEVGESAEIHLIEKNSAVSESSLDEEVWEDDIEEKPQLEARIVSQRINDIVGKMQVYDKKTKEMRLADFGDIAILLRATKGYADCFVHELSSKNIPVFADVNTGYFDNMEVQVILALLKIIDNPYQDIPLIAVLRSKIGDFDVNELTDIRLQDRKCSFYEAMQKAAGQGNSKARFFLEKLSQWREASQYLRLGELIEKLYDETNYYDYVSVMPNGAVRKANLDILLEKAEKFDHSSYRGLFSFINFMDNLKETSGDMGSSKSLGDNENVVRLMSIHKSKGLEFPIVFLCGASRKFNRRDESNPIILHQDFGFGADIIHYQKRVTYESIPKLAIKQKIKEEALSEEMRILYVALTRAREKLIVTCMDSNIDKKINEWSMKQTSYAIGSAKCFADWICGTVMSHEMDWKICRWSYQDVLKLSQEKEDNRYPIFVENIATQFHITEEYDNIQKSFQWHYPYEASTKLPSKITVTELKRMGDKEDTEIDDIMKGSNLLCVPQFIEGNLESGATFGTILHQVMQRISLQDWNSEDVVLSVEEKYRSRIRHYLTQFSQSKLYHELLNAKKIYREMPFNLSLKLGEVYGEHLRDQSAEDTILIQGVIDLYFETEEGIVLVDYKTDHLNSPQEFIERYHTQLAYYKRALETLTGKKVCKVMIYSFYLNQEILL